MKKLPIFFVILSLSMFFDLSLSFAGGSADDIFSDTTKATKINSDNNTTKHFISAKIDISNLQQKSKSTNLDDYKKQSKIIETLEVSILNLCGKIANNNGTGYHHFQKGTIVKNSNGLFRTNLSIGSHFPQQMANVTLTYRYMDSDDLFWGNGSKHSLGIKHEYLKNGFLNSVSNYAYTSWTDNDKSSIDKKYEYGLLFNFGRLAENTSSFLSEYKICAGPSFEKIFNSFKNTSKYNCIANVCATAKTCFGDLQADWRYSDLTKWFELSNTFGPLKFYFAETSYNSIEERRIGFQIQMNFSSFEFITSNETFNMKQQHLIPKLRNNYYAPIQTEHIKIINNNRL